MTVLAGWLETGKSRSGLAGSLLGGPLLADAVSHMQAATAALSSAGADDDATMYYKLLLVSGHYNTQLGLLAALKADVSAGAGAGVTTTISTPAPAIPWLNGNLPKTAAVLSLEMFKDGAAPATAPAFAVRTVAQDGPSASYTVLPLPCASAAGEAIAGTAVHNLHAVFLLFLLCIVPLAVVFDAPY